MLWRNTSAFNRVILIPCWYQVIVLVCNVLVYFFIFTKCLCYFVQCVFVKFIEKKQQMWFAVSSCNMVSLHFWLPLPPLGFPCTVVRSISPPGDPAPWPLKMSELSGCWQMHRYYIYNKYFLNDPATLFFTRRAL